MSTINPKDVAKAALAAAVLTIAAGSAQAQKPYVFTAIDTSQHGADVMGGDYEAAIARIHQGRDAELGFSEKTNLCIAYTKSRSTANAIESCNRAVAIAREKNGLRWLATSSAPDGRRRKDLDLVIALSNRSVAYATMGEHALALVDLQEARALKPRWSAVSTNLAILTEATAR